MSTPMQHTLALLREEGYRPEIVEYWNPFSRTRKDLFNIGDVLALREKEVLLVQTTSASNVSARVRKITECEWLPDIRKAGIRIEVQGWSKKRVGRTWEWSVRRVDLS